MTPTYAKPGTKQNAAALRAPTISQLGTAQVTASAHPESLETEPSSEPPFTHDFGSIRIHPRSLPVQMKPVLGSSTDSAEVEADRVADEVMRMPQSSPPCSCGGGCPLCRM